MEGFSGNNDAVAVGGTAIRMTGDPNGMARKTGGEDADKNNTNKIDHLDHGQKG